MLNERDIQILPVDIKCNFDDYYGKAPSVINKIIVPVKKSDQSNYDSSSKGDAVKTMLAERQKEKEIRAKIIAEEMARIQNTQRNHNSSLFPATTNMENHNHDIHDMSRPIDKTNFKKKNPFSSYVNSMFNSGVFVNPW
jgi:hypothetical protein